VPRPRAIAVRTPEPGRHSVAVGEDEFETGLRLERRVLNSGEALPPPVSLAHLWIGEGTLLVDAPEGATRVGVGGMVMPAAAAAMRAGDAGTTLWLAALPLPAPPSSIVIRAGEGQQTVLAGDLYTVKRRAADTGGLLGMLHFAIPSGGGPIPHIHHADDEVFVVLKGRLSLYADGVRTHAAAGDVVCLPRGIAHGFRNLSGQDAAMLCLLTPGGGEQFFVEAGRAPMPGVAPAADDAEIERILALASRYRLEMRPDIAEPYTP